MLIDVPLTPDEFDRLRAGGLTDVPAYAATPALFEALGYGPEMDEDAEFAALTYASVAALTRAERRLVAVATVPDSTVVAGFEDSDFGAVRVASVAWTQVGSLFVGEDPGLERAAAVAAAGLPLAQAWELPEVAALLESADLLWYSPSEADEVAELVTARPSTVMHP